MARSSTSTSHSIYDSALINITVLNALLCVVCCLVAPLYVEPLQIVTSPLSAIKAWCVVFGAWSCASLWWLQHQYAAPYSSGYKSSFSSKQLVQRFLCGLVAIMVIHLMLVIFGAPLVADATETVHLAMLMTILGVVPPICVLGTSSASWIRVYFLHNPHAGIETLVYACTLGTAIGGWLGAVPIPLDWDRPWQVWPISCSIGAMIGYVCAICIATLYDIYSARVRIDSDKFKLG